MLIRKRKRLVPGLWAVLLAAVCLTAVLTTLAQPATSSVEIVVSSQPETITNLPGNPLTVTIAMTPTTAVTAPITISYTIPAGLTFDSAHPQQVDPTSTEFLVWTIPGSVGQPLTMTQVMTAVFVISDTAVSIPITHTITATVGTATDLITATSPMTITPSSLQILSVEIVSPTIEGQAMTVTVVISNLGGFIDRRAGVLLALTSPQPPVTIPVELLPNESVTFTATITATTALTVSLLNQQGVTLTNTFTQTIPVSPTAVVPAATITPTETPTPRPTETPPATPTAFVPPAALTATSPVVLTATPNPIPTMSPSPTPPSGISAGLLRVARENPLLVGALFAIIALMVVLLLVWRLGGPKSTASPTRSAAPPPPTTPSRAEPAITRQIPAGPSTANAYLKLPNGRTVPLTALPFTIGRDPGSSLVIDDTFPNWQTASSQHAVISSHPVGYVISDQGSQNGLRVQGRPTARNVLQHGYTILIGEVELTFHTAVPTSTPIAAGGEA